MTVIVRVAGWLAGSLFGFHVHETQQFVNSVQEKAKFSQHYCPPTLTTNHLVPFNIPRGVQRAVFAMRNYVQSVGAGWGRRGGRLGGGGFPSVVRTPSVPHFQLPIFIFQKFLCFLHFLCFLCTQGT